MGVVDIQTISSHWLKLATTLHSYHRQRTENKRTKNKEQRTKNNEQWTMNNEQWTMNIEQWTMNNEQWTMNREQRTKVGTPCLCQYMTLMISMISMISMIPHLCIYFWIICVCIFVHLCMNFVHSDGGGISQCKINFPILFHPQATCQISPFSWGTNQKGTEGGLILCKFSFH